MTGESLYVLSLLLPMSTSQLTRRFAIPKIPLIQGFVSTATIPLPHLQEMITLAVISRLSSRRAGTRFNSRGVDEDGNTANFVEVSRRWSFAPPPLLNQLTTYFFNRLRRLSLSAISACPGPRCEEACRVSP